MRLWAAIPVLLWCAIAGADARQDQAARNAFNIGRAAYESGDYQLAHDKFKESFQLSHEPALLYNIASALQGLKRPHDAAEALRSFLRVQPNDPDRPKIEQRIATLEEEQRMIDAERAKAAAEAEAARRNNEPPPNLTPPPPSPPPSDVRTVVVHESGMTEAERKHRRKVLAISLTVGGVVLVGGAIALTLALTQTTTAPLTPTELGPVPATR
jgi:tetratricopeptide (TPR) repeat protein